MTKLTGVYTSKPNYYIKKYAKAAEIHISDYSPAKSFQPISETIWREAEEADYDRLFEGQTVWHRRSTKHSASRVFVKKGGPEYPQIAFPIKARNKYYPSIIVLFSSLTEGTIIEGPNLISNSRQPRLFTWGGWSLPKPYEGWNVDVRHLHSVLDERYWEIIK